MPAGRPPKYHRRYCQMIEEYCRDGESVESFAVSIGHVPSTMIDWANRYPEFAESKKKAQSLSEQWWAKLGAALATGKLKGSAAVWIFTMKARFRWTETVRIEDVRSPNVGISPDTLKELINAAREK